MSNAHWLSAAPSPEALLRFSVLAQVEALVLGGVPVCAAVREVAGREHAHLDGRLIRVSERTVQRWRGAYATGGVAALERRSRPRTETSIALSEALLAFLQAEKRRDPRASVRSAPSTCGAGRTGTAATIRRQQPQTHLPRVRGPARGRPSDCKLDVECVVQHDATGKTCA